MTKLDFVLSPWRFKLHFVTKYSLEWSKNKPLPDPIQNGSSLYLEPWPYCCDLQRSTDRCIDTATVYKNEVHIGIAINEAISSKIVTREGIFLISKLSPRDHGYEEAIAACEPDPAQKTVATPHRHLEILSMKRCRVQHEKLWLRHIATSKYYLWKDSAHSNIELSTCSCSVKRAFTTGLDLFGIWKWISSWKDLLAEKIFLQENS